MIEPIDPILERKLSVRALNCCNNVGVKNIHELKTYAERYDLYSIKNCGKRTVLELQNALRNFPFGLLDSSIEINEQNDCLFPESCSKKIETIFDDIVLSSAEKTAEKFLDLYQDFSDFYDKILKSPDSLYQYDETSTIDVVCGCWDLSLSILEKTVKMFEVTGRSGNIEEKLYLDIKNVYKFLLDDCHPSKISLYISRLSPDLYDVLKFQFIDIKNRLSVRARNFIDKNRISCENMGHSQMSVAWPNQTMS